MALPNYPSPHCHIASLDSASTPTAFAEREVQLGSSAITCTDHGTLGAIPEVYALAKEHGLICIPGLEAYVRDDDCSILTRFGVDKDPDGTFTSYNKYYHITLHTQDSDAYEALVRAVSAADARVEKHGSEGKPLFSWSTLEELGQYNVTMTSGCLIGMVQRHLLSGPDQMTARRDIARAYYERLRQIPKPGKFYVEVFPHCCDKKWVEGVFLVLQGADGVPVKLRFWSGKKLRTTEGEFEAKELARRFARTKSVGALVAIKNERKWEEQAPQVIQDCRYIAEFLPNECRDWAPNGDVQRGANQMMMALAEEFGDKILISDDAHFAVPEDKIVQDCRLNTWRFHNSYHRQTSDEAFQYFHNVLGTTEAQMGRWIENNIEWAASFKGFAFKERKSLPTKFYPQNTLVHLKQLIDKHGRMDWSNQVLAKRLKEEITLLHGNGTIDLLPYFFLAEEVCYLYEQNKMLTGPGRGSAAGMLISYLLGITHVDPIKYRLSQDRFLTLERIKSGKLPDIDQDLPDRDILTDPKEGWLYKRFGDHVAAISTETKLRLKSSIKDVSRHLRGIVLPELEALTKRLPNAPQDVEDINFIFGYVGDDGKEVRGLIQESADLQNYAQSYPKDWELVQRMLGITRQRSRHACAFVITNEPVHHFIPLTTISGVRTTQYEAKGVEAAGGLKMDFLGLNSLKDIQSAIRNIQVRNGGVVEKDHVVDGRRVPGFRMVPFKGRFYDVWDLPVDDQLKGVAFENVISLMHQHIDQNVDWQAAFRDIAEGKTETVFQLNTPSARQWLRQFDYWKDPAAKRKAIDSIETISAFTALDRPGPLDAEVKEADGHAHNMLIEYANRAKGLPPVGNIPALDRMLPETYGVMVYQEQLEATYRELTGCKGAEAEEFRRNVAKKKMDKVKKTYAGFMERASLRIGKEQAQAVFEQMVTFGQYGFNLSHAVCYSVIAYACAFLKHHYSLEWWCAVLSNADKNEIVKKFWKSCCQWVDLPDVRYSGPAFEIQGDRIRAPLSFLNGVGDNAHKELVQYQPITSVEDLCRKISQHKYDTRKPLIDKKTNLPKTSKDGRPILRIGTSALHSGVVSKLIVSGVADSLFAPETALSERLEQFQGYLVSTLTDLDGKKRTPEPVKPEYLKMAPLVRYQLRKAILPIYSEDLAEFAFRNECHGIKPSAYGKTKYVYAPTDEEVVKDLVLQKDGPMYKSAIPVVPGHELTYLETAKELENNQYATVAVVAFVVAEQRFRYPKQAPDKDALKLTFDVNGEVFTFVKWPARKTGVLHAPTDDLTGAIVLLTLTKTKTAKPFSIDAVRVVQPPLDDKPAEDKEQEDAS